MKDLLSSPPGLAYYRPFILHTDASSDGLHVGGVLEHEQDDGYLHPMAYATRPKLLIAFARDSMRECESRANPRDRVSSSRKAANRMISRGIPTVCVHAVWQEILENARDSTR